jgi:hypothetical protein
MLSSPHSHRAVFAAAFVFVLTLVAIAGAGPAGASPVTGGTTKIVLDPTLTADLFSRGFPLYPVPPARIVFGMTGPSLTIPISGGSFSVSTRRGLLKQRGGLEFVSVATGPVWQVLTLRGLRTALTASPTLTALPDAGARTDMFALDLSTSKMHKAVKHGVTRITISNVALVWSAAGDTAFKGVFGTSPGAGAAFGAATLAFSLK